MALTPVPTIDPSLGNVPDPADDEVIFEADAYDFTSRMPGFGADIKAIGDATYANAQWAETKAGEAATSANSANTSATNAATSEDNAAQSAIDAGLLVETYLGSQASDPTTGRLDAPLVDGNWYVNSTSGFIRAYTGAGGWVAGVSAVAGVSSINGLTGAVASPSQTEAEAGLESTKPMNSLRTAQAISAQAIKGSLLRVIVFTASGTWTKGANTKIVKVRLVGGGGGGGGTATSPAGSWGGGGGGGGYAEKIINVSAITTESVTIGASGTSGAGAGSTGTAGGSTSFGSHVSASGGAGGFGYGLGTAPASGGFGSNGSVNASGGVGSPPGQSSGTVRVATGGSSLMGEGGGAVLNADGLAAVSGYGGGGGGGYWTTGTASFGGSGRPGICIVEEYA